MLGETDCTGLSGHWSYIHTIRRPRMRGQVVEVKTQLTHRDYINMLAQRDDSHFTIFKRRRCFLDNNQYFQLDIYREPCHPRWVTASCVVVQCVVLAICDILWNYVIFQLTLKDNNLKLWNIEKLVIEPDFNKNDLLGQKQLTLLAGVLVFWEMITQ